MSVSLGAFQLSDSIVGLKIGNIKRKFHQNLSSRLKLMEYI